MSVVGIKAKIRNRFDFHVEDIATGEKQILTAHNRVLNQMWTYLCNGSSWAGHLHFGRGTGELSDERNTLFARISSKALSSHESRIDMPISYRTRKIVLNPEEFVGEIITEVGIGASATVTSLVTHALLEDAEGNPISLEKTDTMVVTIYATVYADMSDAENAYGGKLKLIQAYPGGGNWLISACLGGGLSAVTYVIGRRYGDRSNRFQSGCLSQIGNASSSATGSADHPNRRRIFPLRRFDHNTANGEFVAEFGVPSIWSACLPLDGVFSGHPHEEVATGVGDDTKTRFNLPNYPIDPASVTLYVDSVEQTAGFTLEQRRLVPAVTVNIFRHPILTGRNGYTVWKDDTYGAVIYSQTGAAGVQPTTMAAIKKTGTYEWEIVSDPVSIGFTNEPLYDTPGWTPAARLGSFSWEGDYIAYCGRSPNGERNNLYLFKVAEESGWLTLTPLDSPAALATNVEGYSVSWSDGATYLALCYHDSDQFLFYKRNGDALTLLTSPAKPVAGATPARCVKWWGQFLLVGYQAGGTSNMWHVYKLNPITDELGDRVALPFSATLSAAVSVFDRNGAWHASGKYLAISVGYGTTSKLDIFKQVAGVFTRLTGQYDFKRSYFSFGGTVWIGDVLHYWPHEVNATNAILMDTNTDAFVSNASHNLTVGWGGTTVTSSKSGLYGEANGRSSGGSGASNPVIVSVQDYGLTAVFDSPLADGEVLTADFIASGVVKSSNWVVDMGFYVEFGEPAP